eukprot:scaffold311583_cov24-Tisochrysis_lutea.AAC.1
MSRKKRARQSAAHPKMAMGGGTLKRLESTMAMSITDASAPLRQNLLNRVTHAAKTKPMEAAFIPTSPQRTH